MSATPRTPATTPATTAPPEIASIEAVAKSAPPVAGGADLEGAIARALDPVGLDRFLADHWGRRPLHLRRAEAGRFDQVLSREDVDRLVSEPGLRAPAFRLVKDGEQLPLSGYTDDVPWRPGSFSGLARPERVADEFRSGATLVLQGLHLHWRPAALFCRGLEAALGCPVQANAYLTPAAAQGFAVHHDTHDVFVLQVAGRKRWLWYEPVVELPLGDQRFSAERHDPGEPVAEFTLEPGDTLYLPRGWPHEAHTSDSDSLHLTVGLHPQTRLDAIRTALAECGDDVEFRRTLEADGTLPDGLLDRLAELLDPALVRERTRRRLIARRRPILDRQLAQAAAVDSLRVRDLVERRPTVLHLIEADGPRPALLFEGKEISVPDHARAALTAAAADGPFSAADLPGPIDEAGRLVLVRRLVREGFLRIL